MKLGRRGKTDSWNDLRTCFLAARQGNTESKEAIFSFLRSRFLGLARYRLPEAWEDIVHDSLVVVHEHFSDMQSLEQLVAFANQVLRNKIGNVYQSREHKTKPVGLENVGEPSYHIIAEIEAGDVERVLRESIEKLGEGRTNCRRILLCLYHGLSPDEICDELKISKSQLKVRTFRCRGALRNILQDDYGMRLV